MRAFLSLLPALLCLTGALAGDPIPGLMPVDLYLNLEQRGFEVKKRFGPNQCEFACSKLTTTSYLTATAIGSASNVRRICATADNYNTPAGALLGREFLALIATMPYTNSHPAGAADWVRENLDRGGKVNFRGVQFEIFAGNRNVRVFEMTRQVPVAPETEAATKPVKDPAMLYGTPAAPDKKPEIGMAYRDAEYWYGEPLIRVGDWAYWPKFKARFEGGLIKEIAIKGNAAPAAKAP